MELAWCWSHSVTPGSGKALCSTEPSHESNEITPMEKALKCLSQTHHWHFNVTMNTTELHLASFCSRRCFLCTFRTNRWAVTIKQRLFYLLEIPNKSLNSLFLTLHVYLFFIACLKNMSKCLKQQSDSNVRFIKQNKTFILILLLH